VNGGHRAAVFVCVELDHDLRILLSIRPISVSPEERLIRILNFDRRDQIGATGRLI
jgi:hypothetical protein